MRQIILASTSPRRKQLMGLLNIKFKVVDSGYEEIIQKHLSNEQLVKFLALGKAQATAKKYPRAIIVAADTMVVFGGKVLGKPKNRAEAFNMLKSFSGKSQDVITGVAVVDAISGKKIVSATKSKTYFKKLSNKQISAYVNSGEPYDKAGGYNLQGLGLNLMGKIEGDFTNLLGMPMGVVLNALEGLGIAV